MGCRGICERYRAERKRYFEGSRRCTCCDVYLFTQENRCPCCNIPLRMKRKAKSKIKLKNNQEN